MKSVSTQEINKFPILTNHQFTNLEFSNVTAPERATNASLVFTSTVEATKTALKSGAKGFIVLEKIWAEASSLFSKEHCVWTTQHIQACMVQVLPLFNHKPKARHTIHPTAVIHSTAKVGASVTLDEYVVIQENAILHEGCWIGAHSVIEASAEIGSNTRLAPHVVVGSSCIIGKSCDIASHTTIGSDGFGLFTDKNHQHHRIPQIGIVVIEDHCELGSHCSVDRATLTETRIKAGSKFDNFCHVAHNVTIGENALITAGFIVAGSTVIGKNLTTGGGSHIVGHVQICDNVTLTGRTGVTSSIETPGVYGGFPQLPYKESLKVLISFEYLPKMRKQISSILRHLKLEE